MSSALYKHKIAKNAVTHACPVRTHENAFMAENTFHWGKSSRDAVNGAIKWMQWLELVIGKDGLESGV